MNSLPRVCRSWLKEILSLVRGEQNVGGANLEQLIKKHNEYRVQVDRQLSKSRAVKDEGRRLTGDGDVLSQEVTEPQNLSA